MTPTRSQQEAINYSGGNLLIVACAGSGKTETISRRIARFVQEGATKDSIIAFTFTEHAASELKARIRRHMEENFEHEPSLGDMYVGTIHSFCLRLLKEMSPQYRNWEVMDEVRQAALISTNFVRWEDSGRGIGLDRLRPETRTGTYWETVRRFTNTLNILHQRSISISDVPGAPLRDAIIRYRKIAYESPNYFFDFDKIIDALIEKLSSDSKALEDVRSKFSNLVVDEYQDIDDRQEHLIQLLTDHGRSVPITAVGDDDQALYGFRGASVRNILTFEQRYPNVHRVNMVDNFRCTHAIVEVADFAIRRVGQRLQKEMTARRRTASGSIEERLAEPGDIQLQTFASEVDEARWVADRIQSLRGVIFEEKDGTSRPLDYADVAILLRSVKSTGNAFARELRHRGIPVVISGTRGLFNNDEVRLIQAAFCLLSRSEFAIRDDSGTLQILSTLETRQFVRDVIDRLKSGQMPTASASQFLGWIDRKLEELDRRSLKRELRGRLSKRIYPQDIFQEMLRRLGSQDVDWPADVQFNLGAFSTLLTQFEAVHQWITPAGLKGLCLFLGNWAASNADEGGIDELVRLNSVQIMTVHGAKGLEWPIVFLPRISSYIFPSSRRGQGPETFLPTSVFDPREYAGGDDGERRLWYVALTRCAKFLHISSLDHARKRPTEFYREIQHDMVRSDGSDPTLRTYGNPRPADDAVMLPTTFSDLTYWWRCHFEYQLRSLMGFSPGVGEQIGYGQQLHNILAEIHLRSREGRSLTSDDVENLVDERFHLRYTQGAPLDALRNAAKKALKRYVLENTESLERTQAVEKPFEFIDRTSGAMITGVVDLIEAIPDQSATDPHRKLVGIVDFKAHRIRTQDAFEALRLNAERQLRLYASAVRYAFPYEPAVATARLVTPDPPSKELANAGVSDEIIVDISDQARNDALDEVQAAVLDIKQSLKSQIFRRTGATNNSCKKCDFRSFCPGFREWKELNPNTPRPLTSVDERELEVDIVLEDYGAGSSP